MQSLFLDFLTEDSRFGNLPQSTLKQVVALSERRILRKGEHALRQGEDGQWMGAITRGTMRIYRNKPGAPDYVVKLLKEKDFCVEVQSFFNGQSALYNIQALEDVELWGISRKSYQSLSLLYPDFKLKIYQVMSEEMHTDLEEKNQLLSMNAAQRYQYFIERHSDLVSRIPLGHISSFLGIRQSSLSRIRRQFSEGKLIKS